MTSLQKRLDELNQHNPIQLNEKNSTLKSENKHLEGQLRSLRTEMDALRSRQTQLKEEKERLQSNVDDKTRELDNANARVQEKEDELKRIQRQTDESDSNVSRLSKEKDRLKSELERLKERDVTLNRDLTSSKENASQLQRQLSQLKATDVNFSTLQEELDTCKRNNERITSDLGTCQSDEQRLQEELRKKESSVSTMSSERDKFKKDIQTLKEEKKALETEKTTQDAELKRVRRELDQIKKEQNDSVTNLTNVQAKLDNTTASVKRDIEQCKDKVSALESEKSTMLTQHDTLTGANQALQSESVTLNQTIADLKENIRQLQELKQEQTDLTKKTKEERVTQLNSEKETLEQDIVKLRAEHQLALEKEQARFNQEIGLLRKAVSSSDETLAIKTSELEALQDRYDTLHRQINKPAPQQDTAPLQAQLQETDVQITQRVTELEQQAKADKSIIDQYKSTLEKKDKELEELRHAVTETKRALDTTQHSYTESINLLHNATDILAQSPLFKGVAEQFKKNMELLRSSAPIHPIEFKADEAVYKYESPEPESFDAIYQEYENVLMELKQVQMYYTKLVTNVTVVNQRNMTFQSDDTHSIVLYSFLTTALFHLTKTYLRLPSVLRMLSLPHSKLGSEANTALRDSILNSFFVTNAVWFDKTHPVNRLLKDINSELYQLYHHTIEKHKGRVRIDMLAYYLMQFVYLIRKTERTSTEYNVFLRMMDSLSQAITANLKLIMYSQIGDTKHKLSALDTIQEQEYRGLRSEHNSSNKVITLVKIRVDGPRPNDINARFDCNLLTRQDKDEIYMRRMLHVRYSDFDYRKKFREDADTINMGNAEFETNGFRFYADNEEPACDLTLIKRNHDFYFGPFTQVYTADQSALDITNDTYFIEGVENKLRNGKPVCIIGYGASGSGKTSTLVYLSYYKNNQRISQDGILAELSNKLSDTYNQSCRIQVYEFEGNIDPGTDQDAISNYHLRKFPAPIATEVNDAGQAVKVYSSFAETNRDHMDPNDPQGTCFEYEIGTLGGKKQWVKSDTHRFTKVLITEQQYMDVAKEMRMTSNGLYYKLVPDLDKSSGVIPMAKDIADFMDNKRNIAATANNPVSSRSHVVIFITYASAMSKTTLVLCDFAGVENRFDCTSESVLAKLATIPTKDTADKLPSEQTPFYQQQMGRIKQKKYEQFDRTFGAELREHAKAVNPNVFANVDYLLRKMQLSPLTNVQSKTAESVFQSVYPASQMVNITTFLERLKRVYALYDTLNNSPVNTMVIVKPISDLLKAEYADNKLSPSTDLYRTLKNKHKIDIARLLDPGTKYQIEMKQVMPVEDNPLITNKIIWLSANYAKELFAAYKTDAERDAALMVWQYYFECMVNVPNPVQSDTVYPVTVDKVASAFTKNICEERVKEGLYINDSLKVLRQFIGQLVQATSSGYAPFIDKCLPLQCNPFYKECFGINEYNPDIRSIAKGSLAEQIMKAPNAKDMTFCIMCVVNFSKKANNPPPSPYIDITALLTEYERLKTVEQQFFMKKRITQQLIQEKITTEFDGAFMSNAFTVNPDIINGIMNHPLLMRPVSSSIIDSVKKYGTYLLDKTKNLHNDGYYLKTLSDLIDILNNSNAITTIGTLQFTDTMAKFGSSTMTCNLTAGDSKIDTTDAKAILNSITPAGAREIYNGLALLETKGKLTRKEFIEQYKPFEALYKPENKNTKVKK
jgi:predicted  nucleic acid-binding Zn-ribbon protein